jgi:large subunit ribosomal protein L28e
VKRKQAGGVQFSRDPLNLLNKHSRKYAGYANSKVRIAPSLHICNPDNATERDHEILTHHPRPSASKPTPTPSP